MYFPVFSANKSVTSLQHSCDRLNSVVSGYQLFRWQSKHTHLLFQNEGKICGSSSIIRTLCLGLEKTLIPNHRNIKCLDACEESVHLSFDLNKYRRYTWHTVEKLSADGWGICAALQPRQLLMHCGAAGLKD